MPPLTFFEVSGMVAMAEQHALTSSPRKRGPSRLQPLRRVQPARLALSPGGRGRRTRSGRRVRGSESATPEPAAVSSPHPPPSAGALSLRGKGQVAEVPLASRFSLRCSGMVAMAEQHAPASSPRRRGPSTPQQFWRMLMLPAAGPHSNGSACVYWVPAFAGMTPENGPTLRQGMPRCAMRALCHGGEVGAS